jgi:uncharacterized repeat protein (TIGR04138 family)
MEEPGETSEPIQKIDEILERDDRYRIEAYSFVMEALGYAMVQTGRVGHVTAAELMAGIRDHALDQFGSLAKTVFSHWGITRSSQFGDIVFNLIDAGLLGKRPEDRREDFDAASFDFDAQWVERSS